MTRSREKSSQTTVEESAYIHQKRTLCLCIPGISTPFPLIRLRRSRLILEALLTRSETPIKAKKDCYGREALRKCSKFLNKRRTNSDKVRIQITGNSVDFRGCPSHLLREGL